MKHLLPKNEYNREDLSTGNVITKKKINDIEKLIQSLTQNLKYEV